MRAQNSLVRPERFFLSVTVMLLACKLLRIVLALLLATKNKGFDKFQKFSFSQASAGWPLQLIAVITGIVSY